MRVLNKYLAFVRIGIARGLSERGEMLGRAMFLPVALGVFTSLWRSVGELGSAGTSIREQPDALVWYLAITEWIAMSVPLVHLEIQEDVVRGDIASQLPRPVSYVGATFCQALGMLCVRMSVLGVVAVAAGYGFTGSWPSPRALAWAGAFGASGTVLILEMYLCLGLAAFWVSDVTPLYWVWQKLLFVLGGLFMPVEYYPAWMQRIGAFTPFPAFLCRPASFVLHPVSLQATAQLALQLSFWTILTALCAVGLFQRALRRVQISGG
jgi:ABC-2 type transport system permease protein